MADETIGQYQFRIRYSDEELPFEDKRRLLKMIFGGRDEEGLRYGIYVKCLGGKPKRFKFEAYGRLGNLDGFIDTGTKRISSFADTRFYTEKCTDLGDAIARMLPNIKPREEYKVHTRRERDAHHRLGLHQRR